MNCVAPPRTRAPPGHIVKKIKCPTDMCHSDHVNQAPRTTDRQHSGVTSFMPSYPMAPTKGVRPCTVSARNHASGP
ncbi:hypothetical protein HBH79_041350 [Parastagonospora nodorum]|nr:hypothetical protein HBH51_055400 [Parastagonospora nodorum]KAH4306998.1 hypothetical protein HBI01_050570 [Parastagonospora nodorum]KAH4336891.1 hypothetical protein HBI00_014170 [Parastagonospora nodorum]KAH4382625.1 hypothetical protein HBH94_058700 [Parastagonospora nodorum]KAH4471450.1 hypothetical protein HBH90_051310 [Parastagonospora nodorum]